MSDDQLRVTNNAAAGQFEIRAEQGIALLKYTFDGDAMDLVHTEVPPAMEGKGYGKALVEAALDYARGEELKVIPSCPFVQSYLKRHPEAA